METIKYKIRSLSSKTPCPHGMMATCTACKMTKPHLVHVGSSLEKDCPFFVADDEKKQEVICEFIPNTFTLYDSR